MTLSAPPVVNRSMGVSHMRVNTKIWIKGWRAEMAYLRKIFRAYRGRHRMPAGVR